jgi:hypothetical protein
MTLGALNWVSEPTFHIVRPINPAAFSEAIKPLNASISIPLPAMALPETAER